MGSTPYLDLAARQAHVLEQTSHRPWPLPTGSWAQAQTRLDALFAHWRVGLDEVARLLPPGLPVDTYDGDAWLGIVPFRLANLRLRGLPPLPRLTFEQLDIRTYVIIDGRPGIWLCSMDVSNPVLLEAARRVHRLPAYRARMSSRKDGDEHVFTCTSDTMRDGLAFGARYRGTGEAFVAQPGTLEHFLTERYCIYTADGGRLYRADVHHPPWRLQTADATVTASTLAPLVVDGAPHALYAAEQDVLVWPLEEL